MALQDDREVRHTVIRVITAHLQKDKDAAMSWQGLNFDFTGAVFDGGGFGGAEFSGAKVSFDSAQFTGDVSFAAVGFSGAQVSFGAAQFKNGLVSFGAAEFSGTTVELQIPPCSPAARSASATLSSVRSYPVTTWTMSIRSPPPRTSSRALQGPGTL